MSGINTSLEGVWNNYRINIIQGVIALIMFILIIISPHYDAVAILTIGLGSVVILIIEIFRSQNFFNIIDDYEFFVTSGYIIGVLLPVVGMFFGNFSAPFSLLVPYSYYFLLSTLITIQLILTVQQIFLSDDESKTKEKSIDNNS